MQHARPEEQLYDRLTTYVKQNADFFSDIEDEFTVPADREKDFSSTQNTTAVATLAMLRLKVYLAPNQMYPSQNEPNRPELEARLAELETFNAIAADAGLNKYASNYRDWSAQLAVELEGPTL
jgi:hypothetical protein